jgi:hypothetical protein
MRVEIPAPAGDFLLQGQDARIDRHGNSGDSNACLEAFLKASSGRLVPLSSREISASRGVPARTGGANAFPPCNGKAARNDPDGSPTHGYRVTGLLLLAGRVI